MARSAFWRRRGWAGASAARDRSPGSTTPPERFAEAVADEHVIVLDFHRRVVPQLQGPGGGGAASGGDRGPAPAPGVVPMRVDLTSTIPPAAPSSQELEWVGIPLAGGLRAEARLRLAPGIRTPCRWWCGGGGGRGGRADELVARADGAPHASCSGAWPQGIGELPSGGRLARHRCRPSRPVRSTIDARQAAPAPSEEGRRPPLGDPSNPLRPGARREGRRRRRSLRSLDRAPRRPAAPMGAGTRAGSRPIPAIAGLPAQSPPSPLPISANLAENPGTSLAQWVSDRPRRAVPATERPPLT